MELTHRLLKRQIKRHVGSIDMATPAWQALIASVDQAYGQFDTDYATLERSLELSSQEQHLANSDIRAVYERLILSTMNGVFAFNCEYCYTVWNASMEQFTNINTLQAIGKNAFDVFPTLKERGLDRFFSEALAGNTRRIEDQAYLNAHTGEQGVMEIQFAPLLSDTQTIIGGLGIIHDITQRKRAEDTLCKQHEYLMALQEMALRLSSRSELDGLLEDILHRSCLLLETPHSFMTLIEPGTSVSVERFSTGIFKKHSGSYAGYSEKIVARVWQTREPVHMNKFPKELPGEENPAGWMAVPLFQGSEIVGVMGVAYIEIENHPTEADVALLKQFAQLASIGLVYEALHEANTRLAMLATVDPLTNLPNHRTVISRIEEDLSRCQRTQQACAILFLDIDHFKSINDTWGHQAGDAILREVGRRLTANVRMEDFVGRYGGEEFALVLAEADPDSARQTAERLRMALCEMPCDWEAEMDGPTISIPMTASIGVALYPEHGKTREQLVEAADLAMYQAKNRGRNQVCIAGEETSIVQEIFSWESYAEATSGSVLGALTAAASVHDGHTNDHAHRMVQLAKVTASILGCSKEEIYLIHLAALLHDIGKIGIPCSILHKPAALNEEEWDMMHRHPSIGCQILVQTGGVFELLSHIVAAHHERWDGKGYPQGLYQDAIPLGARILSVVDSYDAMISDRPYRQAMSLDYARNELLCCAGSQFDPHVVEAFLHALDRRVVVAEVARAG